MSTQTPNPSTLRDIARQTHGHTIGPMPVQDFLDKFLPKIHKHNTRTRKHVYNRVPNKKMYKSFVSRALLLLYCGMVLLPRQSKTLSDRNLCPGFEFATLPTEAKNSTSSGHKLRPGIAVYPQGARRNFVCDWPLMEFFIEWRPDDDFDCYYEASVDDKILDDSCDEAFEMRGQMFTYAVQLMDCQHRLFVLYLAPMLVSIASILRVSSSLISFTIERILDFWTSSLHGILLCLAFNEVMTPLWSLPLTRRRFYSNLV